MKRLTAYRTEKNSVHAGRARPDYTCDVAFVGSNGIGYPVSAWPYRRELPSCATRNVPAQWLELP
jgi:hypothetical protein